MARLDRALVDRGLARSRSQAQAMISAGQVAVNGRTAVRAAAHVDPLDAVAAAAQRYVSRAAHKLTGALDDLAVEVPGRVLDAGASTGGFTQVLLERGAERVYAVDVGTDQLADPIRNDPRVVVWEQTNLRDLRLSHVGNYPVELVVADVSFISLTMLLEPLSRVVRADGQLLVMIKPQFEVGRELLGKGGVVRSEPLRLQAVDRVLGAAAELGWCAASTVPSRLPGPAGNVEVFALLRRPAMS